MLSNPPDNLALFNHASDDFRADFIRYTTLAEIPGKTTICHQGNLCEQLPILLSGQARVYKLSESGREITLYRIGVGESCVLTASCIMSSLSFPAMAITESDVEAILIPQKIVISWFDKHTEWRKFVFEMVSRRMSDLLTVVEEIAFQRMDVRLANYLLSKSNNEDSIKATHQGIADELGTAREVVTRLLNDMEADGKISIHRGLLKIVDREKLSTML